ncbi:MAG: hypothetical protein REI11_10855, partial [Patulibacter sp.]|nr:hypothetical protein [Patulibacter sp.]
VQLPDGHFPDPIYGDSGDYGTAMLGYAMLRRGAARGDRSLISGGLAALMAQVTQPQGGAFEFLILARAYRWANGALPGNPIAAPMWAKFGPKIALDLESRPAPASPGGGGRCYADARCYNNLKLVTSLAAVQLLGSTDLTPASPEAWLADVGLRGRVLHRVASRVPKEAGSDVTRVGASPISGAGVLSDPPRNPLAYHALSTMMLGELNDALGDDAPEVSKQAFGRAAQALLALASPSGDMTWYGRGQGQVWVPAVVADAAAQAAAQTTSPQLRGRYLALAEAALTRLRDVYGVGTLGFPLVPGALDAATLAARKVDAYATDRGYNGLAVDALDRASAVLDSIDPHDTATRVPSSRPGLTRSPSQAGLATITRGPLWVAIASKSRAPEDSRYGSGLLSMEHRDAAGTWSAIAPGRADNPRVVNTLAVRSNGVVYSMSGSIQRARTEQSVGIVGGWAENGRAATLDLGTTYTWSMPDSKTVQAQFVTKSDRIVMANGLVGDGSVVSNTPFGFVVTRPDGTAIQYSLGVPSRRLALVRMHRDAGASAYDAHLGDEQLSAQVRKGERVTLKIRVIATAPAAVGG